jgi:hypothetical protein
MQPSSNIRRIAIVLAFLAFAAVCHAHIFRIWGGARPGMSLDQLGAKELYHSKVQINDGSGNLTVYGWGGSFDGLLSDLRRSIFADKGDMAVLGDGMAFGIVEDAGTVSRMVLLKMKEDCVLFQLAQSRREFELSTRASSTHLLTGMPSFPDSEPMFFMENTDTRTSIEISSTKSRPVTVVTSLHSALTSDGWQSPFPDDGSARFEGSTFRVYLRKKDMCCILATDRTDGTGAMVLVMHKKL